ncbi:MAG: Flp pilus assembly complex ATPase component TadA [Phycisphaerales bacterium]|nr:Flp pilus assembly complex ATPase component TadA [Phycisphaerales bacterium]
MGKYNIDDILSQLGVDDQSPLRRPAPPERKVHTVDKQEGAFSPVPAAPAHQRPGDDKSRTNLSGPAGGAEEPGALAPRAGETAREPAREDLGDTLVARGVITGEQLALARTVVRQSPGKRLADVLIEQGADEPGVQQVVAELAGVPFERVDLEKGLDGGFDGKLVQRLGMDFCKASMVLPLRMERQRPVVGVTRADDVGLRDELLRRLGVPSVKLVMVAGFDIRGALEILGGGPANEPAEDIEDLLADVEEGDVEVTKESGDVTDLEAKAGETPVIRYVNHIISTAIREGASDIHIEPQEKKLKVRFRIDGVLFEMMNPPASMGPAITSRLKIMANLDIAERRLPQDGRIRCTVQGRKLDLRMSTIPTAQGLEKTVMRILDTRSINRNLEELGFDPSMLELWKNAVDAPHGIVLVTGPTGSGKTTTLYASLRTLDKGKLNISTVEDPVEYHLDGITQTQAHEKIGMTFSAALRALLRQDPDVIMLGEIRDKETAGIAIQAALTGHLVLSTLHTNDAPSSVTRLVNIGIEPFLVGAAVNAVLAQRLIRRLCVHCKVEQATSEETREYLAMQGLDGDTMWSPKGCERCRGTGYSGRVGIYELLVIDDQMRDIVARNPNVSEFRRLALERGMTSLQQDGIRKVAQGLTTVEEVLNATSDGH